MNRARPLLSVPLFSAVSSDSQHYSARVGTGDPPLAISSTSFQSRRACRRDACRSPFSGVGASDSAAPSLTLNAGGPRSFGNRPHGCRQACDLRRAWKSKPSNHSRVSRRETVPNSVQTHSAQWRIQARHKPGGKEKRHAKPERPPHGWQQASRGH